MYSGPQFTQLLAAIGDRPLGIQAAQLIAVARWLSARAGAGRVRLESTGPRSQVTALIAAALEPSLFPDVKIHAGMPSLTSLLETPVAYAVAPGVLNRFDLPQVAGAIADRPLALLSPLGPMKLPVSVLDAGETFEWTRKAYAGVQAGARFRVQARDPELHPWEQYLAALEASSLLP